MNTLKHKSKAKSFGLRFSTAGLVKLAGVLFLFNFLGCQYDPHAHLLTTEEPNNNDIVGTYVLDSYYLPNGSNIENCGIKVEIHANGTFSATNIPPWELGTPDANFLSSLISGTGKWEKSVMGTLDPGARKIWGIYLRADSNRFLPADFTGDKFPYGLIFTLGDPDSGYAILLKKQADK